MNTKHQGSDFDDFLAEEGLSTDVVIKRVIAYQTDRKALDIEEHHHVEVRSTLDEHGQRHVGVPLSVCFPG